MSLVDPNKIYVRIPRYVFTILRAESGLCSNELAFMSFLKANYHFVFNSLTLDMDYHEILMKKIGNNYGLSGCVNTKQSRNIKVLCFFLD